MYRQIELVGHNPGSRGVVNSLYDHTRAQVEIFPDDFNQLTLGLLPCTKCVDRNGKGFWVANDV